MEDNPNQSDPNPRPSATQGFEPVPNEAERVQNDQSKNDQQTRGLARTKVAFIRRISKKTTRKLTYIPDFNQTSGKTYP